MVIFHKFQRKTLKKYLRAQNFFWFFWRCFFFIWTLFATNFYGILFWKLKNFTLFTLFFAILPPKNDTYVHVHNCTPPWVPPPHNCHVVHALMCGPPPLTQHFNTVVCSTNFGHLRTHKKQIFERWMDLRGIWQSPELFCSSGNSACNNKIKLKSDSQTVTLRPLSSKNRTLINEKILLKHKIYVKSQQKTIQIRIS